MLLIKNLNKKFSNYVSLRNPLYKQKSLSNNSFFLDFIFFLKVLKFINKEISLFLYIKAIIINLIQVLFSSKAN